MRRARYVKGAALVALLLAAAFPSSAKNYRAEAAVVRIATFAGKVALPGGGTGEAIVEIRQGDTVSLEGPFQIFPAASGQPWLGAPQNAVIPTAQYEGCITVKIAGKTDKGCKVLLPVTVESDPLLNEGYATFAVESAKFDGWKLSANLIFAGTGTPAPTQNLDDVTITPAPPAQPRIFEFLGGAFMTRAMEVTGGFVKSDQIGGGSVSQTGSATMAIGLATDSRIDAAEMLCFPLLGNTPLGVCPI